jgi:hypothetical protein
MPDAVERRITAALAAEAAARQASPAAAVPRKATAPAGGGPRRRRNFRPAMAFASAAACLLLVGFGYLLSRTSSSSSSSGAMSEASARAAAPVTSPEAGAQAPVSGGKAKSPADMELPARFVVVESGTKYEQAKLAAQVATELARNDTGGGASAGSGAVPSQASASGPVSAAGGTGGSPPSRGLAGCVSHLTAAPRLVDQATYQGKAVYVIADAHHAWVVGRGCTADNTDVIAKVTLPGAG